MINLIPNTEKKAMAKAFYYRLFVVFFIALGASFLIATLSITPAYILSSVKKDLADTQIAEKKTVVDTIGDQASEAAIAQINSSLALIKRVDKDKFFVSHSVVDQILKAKMSDIKITQISYSQNPDRSIDIRGEAPSRDRLLQFSRSLDSNPLFDKVDLPISNFVKGSNINFSISIKLL